MPILSVIYGCKFHKETANTIQGSCHNTILDLPAEQPTRFNDIFWKNDLSTKHNSPATKSSICMVESRDQIWWSANIKKDQFESKLIQLVQKLEIQ